MLLQVHALCIYTVLLKIKFETSALNVSGEICESKYVGLAGSRKKNKKGVDPH